MAFLTKLFSFFLLIPALFGLYKADENDTEEAFLNAVDSIAYENTIETAVPQTEIYNKIVSHYSSPYKKGTTEKKAIVLGYDGCRADALTMAVDPMSSAIKRMVNNGASLQLAYCGGVNFPDGENTQATSTAPGWCSVLTGVWADKNGVYGNGQPKNMEYKTLMTELIENGTIDSAAFITKWGGHFEDDDSTYLPEKEYCEANGLDVEFKKCLNDSLSGAATLVELSKDDCADFIIAIYEGTDAAGHSFGFSTNNPLYQKGYRLNESLALAAINAIETRATYHTEDWLIIITSDHGGIGTGHGGASIQERMVFIVSNK